jgi:TatD DNase family protein
MEKAMYCDSHFHLDSFAAKGELPGLLERARAAGLSHLVAIGGSDAANDLAFQTAVQHPGFLHATAAYDRDLANTWNGDVTTLRSLLARPEVVAVGECGIDYFHKENDPAAQKNLFAAMLDLALEFRKPVVVHSREAEADTLDLLRDFSARWPDPSRPCAVLHCFTGGMDFAKQLVDLNLLISFSGIVTFRNGQPLRDVAAILPADALLIETDSPYLTPVPHRGLRNEPAFVPHVAACLAEVRQQSPEDIARLTLHNAARFFGF